LRRRLRSGTGRDLAVGRRQADDHGEVELRIAADCTLLFVEHEKSGHGRRDHALHVGATRRLPTCGSTRAGREARIEIETPSRQAAGVGSRRDICVALSRQERTAWNCAAPTTRTFAHRIIDGKIKGEARRNDGSLRVA
jgi:hypothetical protein